MPEPGCPLQVALGLSEKEVVAFVGGGGKTAALTRLARELGSLGRRVLATTTTRMYPEELKELGPLVITEDFNFLMERLKQELSLAPVVSAGLGSAPGGKLLGLPADWVDEIWHSSIADYILVEADGSRGKSLKAPAEHEPVIPRTATLVVPVAGLDVLEKSLTPEHAHRPELVSKITGLHQGLPITSGVVAGVMSHPSGYARGLPPGARVVPLINKVDQPSDLPAARQLALDILSTSKNIKQVLLANCGRQPFFCVTVTGKESVECTDGT